jgi:signal transduction histidine kinase
VRAVFIDSGQVVSALANVITNAVESYQDALGPIKILIDPGQDSVRMEISDLGCGMDEAAQRKAMYPFFSAKSAGRQRGMGLAYATRLIHLNGGTLTLESQAGHGTTVTVSLPYE